MWIALNNEGAFINICLKQLSFLKVLFAFNINNHLLTNLLVDP